MVEYRVLSSAMMKDTGTLNFVWDQLCKAVRSFELGRALIDPNLVREAINNSNTELALKLIADYNILD